MRQKNIVIKRYLRLSKELNELKKANAILLEACKQSLGLFQAVMPKFDDVTILAEQVWAKTKKDLQIAISKAEK